MKLPYLALFAYIQGCLVPSIGQLFSHFFGVLFLWFLNIHSGADLSNKPNIFVNWTRFCEQIKGAERLCQSKSV